MGHYSLFDFSCPRSGCQLRNDSVDIRDSKISFTDEDAGSLGLTNCLDDVEPHAEMSYKELLAFGIRKEDKSYRLYTQLAQYSKSMKFKEVFSQLAQEEAHHRLNLELEYDLTSF